MTVLRSYVGGAWTEPADEGRPVLDAHLTCGRVECDETGTRRDQAVECEHLQLGTRVARGKRLAMRPDPQHRVATAGVELGHDDDLRTCAAHQRRCVITVRWASPALRYGRVARNARASATAASRG